MISKGVVRMYEEYERSRGDLSGMFSVLADAFTIDRVLYPGSYIHLSPSLIFPSVVYVDTDRRAKKFFSDRSSVETLVDARKQYDESSGITFHHADYTTALDEPDESFDLLISLYASFVSEACKRYLHVGGWLVANNSHGDASMASVDPDYEFVAAIKHRSGRYGLASRELDSYFVPKRDVEVTPELLRSTGRGVGYTKSADAYVFRRRH
ncbi:class I SAM-dependent methyltransferase [Rubrobacter aplysinae]|uniref:class I SAM-dependent methyltransferase n=1 Tax=Rubrobacter aplysinae TaxID=909625 RepID=UPI000AB73DBA|nr:class I SAM-dependent methyltransferase [Rubrobacter aplysinae]